MLWVKVIFFGEIIILIEKWIALVVRWLLKLGKILSSSCFGIESDVKGYLFSSIIPSARKHYRVFESFLVNFFIHLLLSFRSDIYFE